MVRREGWRTLIVGGAYDMGVWKTIKEWDLVSCKVLFDVGKEWDLVSCRVIIDVGKSRRV